MRWRAQDADGALLRDQLREAAHIWDERGRPDDLLWTGSTYGEFQVWRERYPGGLTAMIGLGGLLDRANNDGVCPLGGDNTNSGKVRENRSLRGGFNRR